MMKNLYAANFQSDNKFNFEKEFFHGIQKASSRQ